MKLEYDNIHEYCVKFNNQTQITLDDDFNVQDSKADIDAIVKECGTVTVDSIKVNKDKAQVLGTLKFSMLYTGKRESDGRHMPVRMEGQLHFNENINLTEDATDAYVTCKAILEDLTIKAINTRKISVKAIVTLKVCGEVIKDIPVAINVNTSTDGENDTVKDSKEICLLKDCIEYVSCKVNTRDNFRIRENVTLPASLPEIEEILWEDLDVRNLNTRLDDNGLEINGELNVFIMYLARDEGQSLQWYETSVPFGGKLDIGGTNPDMISYTDVCVVSKNVEPRQDYDGENKEIVVELVMDMDVKGYEECKKEALIDLYCPTKNTSVSNINHKLKKLVVRNNSKCRAIGNVKIPDYLNLLQICNCTAKPQIDDIQMEEDGLVATGAVVVNVFFVTTDDNSPMGSVKSVIPFSHKILIKTSDSMEYQIRAELEQLTASVTATSQIEIKAGIALDVICFEPFLVNAIDDFTLEDMDMKEYSQIPSMIGYQSQGDDTLWIIAKKYHTTTDLIRQSNPKVAEKLSDTSIVKNGEKLLLVKSGM